MEAWVGTRWDRLIRRAADRLHPEAAVELTQVQRSIGMMFRAAGGAHALRIAPASDSRIGGARNWLQRVAGTGTHAAISRLEADALSLPPTLAVHGDAELNRALYLWLAAQAACFVTTGDWVGDNLRASQWALQCLPGLTGRYRRLLAAELALRPDPTRLRPRAAEAERLVRCALSGQPPTSPTSLLSGEVAPVWLWLSADAPAGDAMARDHDTSGAGDSRPSVEQDTRRRRASAVVDDRNRAPLLMFFRAESILSWGEFVKVNRADDDDDDGNALAAANDMDELAIATDGQTSAARVKFDLDLPSAAADDRPMGPGIRLPEWDYRRATLIPGHCALQTLVDPEPPMFTPPAALRATARRVRRHMDALRAGVGRSRARAEGDELDLDAWIRYRVDAATAPRDDTPAVFTRRDRSQRSLATLLLADLSLSTDAYATQTARVIDVIRDALYVFGEALSASGDPFEMLGFSSVRRQNVRIQHLKGFDEAWTSATRNRVGAIRPGYYTRMGAAIRFANRRLGARPERQRILLLLTDGKPNDLDIYEGRYGLEDTRHALQAARNEGLIPFCITIDESAHDYLPMLFGEHGYARVHRPQDLATRLTGLYVRLIRDSPY